MRIVHKLSNAAAFSWLAGVRSDRPADQAEDGVERDVEAAIRVAIGFAGAVVAALVGYAIGWCNGGHSTGVAGALLTTAVFCASYGSGWKGEA